MLMKSECGFRIGPHEADVYGLDYFSARSMHGESRNVSVSGGDATSRLDSAIARLTILYSPGYMSELHSK